ncbi:MAG TPA: class I SAM-dependent methyltransferase [Lysobacter sp.]
MSELPLTGERVIEEAYRRSPGLHAIYLMHVASYQFAEPLVRGKRVLDLGCGSGYGAQMLAETAADVVGVDVSSEAIAYAASHHSAPNLSHRLIVAGERLPFADASFDVVVSFQVIEHVWEDAAYVQEARRMLRPGGQLVMITPDRRHRLLPGQRPWNRWHVREYGAAGFRALIESSGFNVKLRFMTASGGIDALELKRYRALKWVTLPFTFPGCPESFRKWGLNLLHRFQGQGPADAASQFKVEDISIGDDPTRSLNLVAVATQFPRES